MLPGVGEKAPEFTLIDEKRKARSLKEFQGKKTVLAFFPGAFTSVCTKELCKFRDSFKEFQKLDAEIVGISVDPPFSNKGYSETHGFTFPLLSDYSRDVIRTYGIVHEDFLGLKGYDAAKRAVFILDREGSVAYSWVTEDPSIEPNYQEVIRALESIP